MRRWCAALVVFGLMGCAAAPIAPVADLDDGLKAYEAEEFEKAARAWRPLAESGHARAQLGLGMALLRMTYRSVSPTLSDERQKELFTEARKWLHLSAEQGHPGGQYELGDFYRPTYPYYFNDPEKAVYWFKKAAAQDYAPAMYMLGAIYGDRQFEGHDSIERTKWFILYDERRYGPEFRTTHPNVRKSGVGGLTSEQLREAERRAKAWKPDAIR